MIAGIQKERTRYKILGPYFLLCNKYSVLLQVCG